MPGTFTFKPIKAELSHDTDLIGKMNPYCSLSVGHSKVKSEICPKGGKTPKWFDELTVSTFSDEHIANLDLMDKENDLFMRHDDLIGSCSINLKEVEKQGHLKKWYSLFFKDSPAGQILMDISFHPEGGSFNTDQSLNLGSSLLSTEEKIPTAATSKLSTDFDENLTINVSAEKSRRKTSTKKESLDKDLGHAGTGPLLSEQKIVVEPVQTIIVEPVDVIKVEEVIHSEPRKVFTEQKQVVEARTFLKDVEAVETIPVTKEIEVMEPRKVLKEVSYSALVPVVKRYEITEPVVITREVDVVEPQVITRFIKVIENVPVKKMIEIVEMHKEQKEIEVLEPQTFKKQVEVIEYVPVKRMVEITEPVTVTKTVEFIEPVITTQTIVKEMMEPMIVGEKITQEIGPATMLGERTDVPEIITVEETVITNIEPKIEIIEDVKKI